MAEVAQPVSKRIGRYLLHAQIAAGGMGTVHLGRMLGAVGFSRTVAIKRLHSQLASEPEFISMFVDEARLASRVSHPNVVQTLDVVVDGDEVLVVMEYVHGESLASLIRKCAGPVPPAIACGIVVQMLYGLHAAHEAVGLDGKPLDLVHRDVSPQNVVIGADGNARLLDFGVAKATWRLRETRDGSLRGKLGYMSPEQLAWENIDRRADVYAAAIVLWEALTGRRLFKSEGSTDVGKRVRGEAIAAPSSHAPAVPSPVDVVLAKGLAHARADRFSTAREMAIALERAIPLASAGSVADWVAELASESLAARAREVRAMEEMEARSSSSPPADQRAAAVVSAAEARARDKEEPTAPSADGAGDETPIVTATATVPTARGTRKKAGLALGVAALAISIAAGVMFSRDRTGESRTPAATAPPSASVSEVVPTSASVVEVASAATAPPVPPAASSASVSPPSSASSGRAAPINKARPAAAPKASAKKGASCNPNYTVDAKGEKHFKPECF